MLDELGAAVSGDQLVLGFFQERESVPASLVCVDNYTSTFRVFGDMSKRERIG